MRTTPACAATEVRYFRPRRRAVYSTCRSIPSPRRHRKEARGGMQGVALKWNGDRRSLNQRHTDKNPKEKVVLLSSASTSPLPFQRQSRVYIWRKEIAHFFTGADARRTERRRSHGYKLQAFQFLEGKEFLIPWTKQKNVACLVIINHSFTVTLFALLSLLKVYANFEYYYRMLFHWWVSVFKGGKRLLSFWLSSPFGTAKDIRTRT